MELNKTIKIDKEEFKEFVKSCSKNHDSTYLVSFFTLRQQLHYIFATNDWSFIYLLKQIKKEFIRSLGFSLSMFMMVIMAITYPAIITIDAIPKLYTTRKNRKIIATKDVKTDTGKRQIARVEKLYAKYVK
jgi:hypothetical protein